MLAKYEELQADSTIKAHKEEELLKLLGNRIEALKSILDLTSVSGIRPHTFMQRFTDYIKVESNKDSALASDLISMANILYNNVIDHILAEYPSFTSHELCYCACICLGFSPECIRVLFNHTNTSSIYTVRSKVRTKLGITNSKINLVTFLRNMRDSIKTQEACEDQHADNQRL